MDQPSKPEQSASEPLKPGPLPEQKEGQYLTMTITGEDSDPAERGHWSSPDHVRMTVAAAVAVERERCGWRPIESAPKDGTLLMLLDEWEEEPFFGRWNEFRSRWVASTTHYDTDGNACVIDNVYGDGVKHWMPVPMPVVPPAPESTP